MSDEPLAVKFDLKEFAKLIQMANSAAGAFDNLNKRASSFKAGNRSVRQPTLRPEGSGSARQFTETVSSRRNSSTPPKFGSGLTSAFETNTRLAASAKEKQEADASKSFQDQRRADIRMRQRDAQFDARVQKMRQRKARQASSRSVGGRLKNLISSTRFSMQGGKLNFSPLIGRAMAALGPEVAIAVTAFTALVAAVGSTTEAAVQAAKGLQELGNATGSRGGTRGALSGLGSALGLNLGSLSEGFQSRITSDPMARMYAAQMGISALPRPFGDVDEGKNLLQAIEQLRKLPFNQRLRAARGTGLEGALPFADLSDAAYQKAKERGGLREKLFGDQDSQTKVADFSAAASGFGDAIQNLLGVLGKTALPAATRVLNNLADGINSFAEMLNKAQGPMTAFVDFVSTLIGLVTGLPGFSGDSPFSGSPASTQDQASSIHSGGRAISDALNSVADQINGIIMPGTYGRGDRMGRAFPAAMNGAPGALDINNREGFRLGAY